MIRVIRGPERKHHGTGGSSRRPFDRQELGGCVSRRGVSCSGMNPKLAGSAVSMFTQETTEGKLGHFVIHRPRHSLVLAPRGGGCGL